MKELTKLAKHIAQVTKDNERKKRIEAYSQGLISELRANKIAILRSEVLERLNLDKTPTNYELVTNMLEDLIKKGILAKSDKIRTIYYYHANYKEEFEALLNQELNR